MGVPLSFPPVTRVTFTKPLGNIRVDFPFGDREPYEVGYGHVALTAAQATEAAEYGWNVVEKYGELVEVARSSIAYQALVSRLSQ